MWSEIKWIANFKLVLEMLLAIGTVCIVFFTWKVYMNQLKVMEYEISPKFKIDVLIEPVNDTYERYIQVTNLGNPIKTKIDTQAIMTVQVQDEGQEKNTNILLDGYFYETDDMIANGTSMSEELCRRGTDFCDAYIRGKLVIARQKLNEAYVDRKIPIYCEISYLVKIEYNDYSDKQVSKYYSVGNFQNQEIEEVKYNQFLNTQYSLDVGDYLNSPIDDKMMDILMKTLN